MESPEYLICPVCKEKIKLDYDVGRGKPIKTEDISVIYIESSRISRPKDDQKRRLTFRSYVNICNHCNGIIGTLLSHG